ncbi:MAG: hypothetical protein NZ841_02195 [Dictyoglomus sp.]|nr:hypothetical protein [Dictyoglomus sp.]MCX7941799.1 hypothetical protein [Dictyoglomaceae bacterium]MDW8188098.1 hypothetical protein [Dictyoglomus sp.]
MDLNTLLKEPKFRIVMFIVGSLLLIGGVGYYYYANFLVFPPETEVKPKVVSTPFLTDTLTQMLNTLTYKEIIYTYTSINLGRSNPFASVITIPKEGTTLSSSRQVVEITRKEEKISTPVKIIPKGENFAKNFRLTGIIKVEKKYYAILEEGDKGYFVKSGQILRDNIYVSKIDDESLTLRKGNEIAILKLGGD